MGSRCWEAGEAHCDPRLCHRGAAGPRLALPPGQGGLAVGKGLPGARWGAEQGSSDPQLHNCPWHLPVPWAHLVLKGWPPPWDAYSLWHSPRVRGSPGPARMTTSLRCLGSLGNLSTLADAWLPRLSREGRVSPQGGGRLVSPRSGRKPGLGVLVFAGDGGEYLGGVWACQSLSGFKKGRIWPGWEVFGLLGFHWGCWGDL